MDTEFQMFTCMYMHRDWKKTHKGCHGMAKTYV